jgi:hypothetical protein
MTQLIANVHNNNEHNLPYVVPGVKRREIDCWGLVRVDPLLEMVGVGRRKNG